MSSFFSIHQLLISINFSLFQFVQQQAPNQQNRPIFNLPSHRTAAAYLYNPTTKGNTFDASHERRPFIFYTHRITSTVTTLRAQTSTPASATAINGLLLLSAANKRSSFSRPFDHFCQPQLLYVSLFLRLQLDELNLTRIAANRRFLP